MMSKAEKSHPFSTLLTCPSSVIRLRLTPGGIRREAALPLLTLPVTAFSSSSFSHGGGPSQTGSQNHSSPCLRFGLLEYLQLSMPGVRLMTVVGHFSSPCGYATTLFFPSGFLGLGRFAKTTTLKLYLEKVLVSYPPHPDILNIPGECSGTSQVPTLARGEKE